MICLYILGILSICMQLIFSCDVHVCLTWEAKKENITFKCKVSRLKFRVHFFNPKNEEEGYCASPIPKIDCYSSHNVITQDRKTNTTVLVIQRHVDNKLNGPWKCSHGTNVDAAIVNVTVIHQEIVKTIFKNNNCGEQHMAWTFIGVMICLVIVCILITVVKACQINFAAARGFIKGNWCKCCCISSKKCYVTKLASCILLIISTILVPYVSGFLETSCKDEKYFIIFGVCMVFIFVACLLIPRKGEQNIPPTDCDTASNIQLLDGKKQVAEKNKSEEE